MMSTAQVIVQGVLKSDGTLDLDQKPSLPPGRVEVTVTSLDSNAKTNQEKMAVLQEIWDEQNRLGMVPRSAHEIDAEIREMRDEWEERQLRLDQLLDEDVASDRPCIARGTS